MKRLLYLPLFFGLLFGQAKNTITNDGTRNQFWYVGNSQAAKVGIGINQKSALPNNLTVLDGGDLGSYTFAGGWDGKGWKLSYADGEYTWHVDNMDVRGTLSVYELLINQMRATNGNLIVSSAAKVDVVGKRGIDYWIEVEDVTNHGIAPFAIGDLIVAQVVNPSGATYNTAGDINRDTYLVKRLIYRVESVAGLRVTLKTVGYAPPNVGIPAPGDAFVRFGSISDEDRQGSVAIYADVAGGPYIRISDNVNSWTAYKSLETVFVQLGDLSQLTTPNFGQLLGSGLWARGNIYLENGFIALSDSGYVLAGKSSYSDATAGFFLGNDSGTPKFNIGDATDYLKWDGGTLNVAGDIVLNNQSSISLSGFNNDIGAGTGNHTYYSASAPSSPNSGDFWFDTSVAGSYLMNRYNGATWDQVSVYMDGSGIYTSTLTAGQVTAGTFTGLTFETNSIGQRVVINGSTNAIDFYDGVGSVGSLTGSATYLNFNGTFTVDNKIYAGYSDTDYETYIDNNGFHYDYSGAGTRTMLLLSLTGDTFRGYLHNGNEIPITGFDFTLTTGDLDTDGFVDAANGIKINGTQVISSGRVLANITDYNLSASDMPSGIDASDIADGSVSDIEYLYLDGVTSDIQTQLNAKAPSTGINATSISSGAIDNTEFNFLNGVTGGIQGQIDDRVELQSTGTQTLGGTSYSYGFLFQRDNAANAPVTLDQYGAGLILDGRNNNSNVFSIENDGGIISAGNIEGATYSEGSTVGHLTSAFGSVISAGLFLSSTSGGATTRQLKYVPLTINGTTYQLLVTTP